MELLNGVEYKMFNLENVICHDIEKIKELKQHLLSIGFVDNKEKDMVFQCQSVEEYRQMLERF
jgi:uncharacterized protein YPO0396